MGLAVAQTEYREAPQLAQQVEAGQLPPINERLPNNPLVLEPLERIGEYGGTWNSAITGGGDRAWFVRSMDYDHLVSWDPEWTTVVPNVAEAVEVNEDYTEYTFRLREGMKWSDGHPFTADDILFWYEDVLMNVEVTPTIGTIWQSGGEPGVVEKIDDYTVKFTFAAPHGLFLSLLATPVGDPPTRYPRHYVQQFLPKYNPEGIDALVRASGLADWVALINSQTDWNARWSNTDLPRLTPWVVTQGYGEGAATRVVAERNPYYWKVDPEGNQLPYIDRLTYDIINDVEVLTLKVLNGEINMMNRHFNTLPNKALFIDNMERGNYHLFATKPSYPNYMNIAFNLTHPNPVMREIFQNKDFRIGLSHAINRQELIDLIWMGQGAPWQVAPTADSVFYNEQLAMQYTEYDVDLANEYLDRAGYTERDQEGFRLGPDGNRISFGVDVFSTASDQIDALDVIQLQWREVGIDMQLRVMDRSIIDIRTKDTSEFDVHVNSFGGGGGALDTILDPRWILPMQRDSVFANAWRNWYLGGAIAQQTRAEEPPEAMKRQMELYDQLKATGDLDQQIELMNEIIEIAAEEFWVMGISYMGEGYGVVHNNFHNVLDPMPYAWQYPDPAPTRPEQYFISTGN
jgi:peptide/nickel transport system substrate-binding protein